jgi:hypothetical protein
MMMMMIAVYLAQQPQHQTLGSLVPHYQVACLMMICSNHDPNHPRPFH